MDGWMAFGRSLCAYPGIHEDKVHLHERENHLQQGVHATQDLVTGRGEGNLEEGAQLQASVNHRSQTEG